MTLTKLRRMTKGSILNEIKDWILIGKHLCDTVIVELSGVIIIGF